MSDRKYCYVYIFRSLSFFLHKADEIQCLPEQTYFFQGTTVALCWIIKALPAIHIMQLQLECSWFLYFCVAFHKHNAEFTGRVINVNNLFSV